MVNPERSKKKGGVQVCVLFTPAIYDDIIQIMKIENRWFKETDFVRDAVNEKLDRWKKEHSAYGQPDRVKKGE